MKNIVRVKDIDPAVLQGPYSLRLGRAVSGPYLTNGATYLAAHVAPADLHDFFLVVTLDETTADPDCLDKKLMVEGGTQYGCSAKTCPFCPFAERLKFYRNLTVEEMIDLFKIGFLLYRKLHSFDNDQREISFKFTDNGEPFHSPLLPEALDRLLELFGQPGKVLRIKISTILKDTRLTRRTFQEVVDWQRLNARRASIHLQISRAPYGQNLMPVQEVTQVISRWAAANPADGRVCIAPGLIQGFDAQGFWNFCEGLKEVAPLCFLRPSIIKPSMAGLEKRILDFDELTAIENRLREMNFDVRPLPRDPFFLRKLKGAGTLSHLPNGKLYDPATYRVWPYAKHQVDPNTPIW